MGWFRIPISLGWLMAAVAACGGLYYFANRALYYPVKFPHGDWGGQSALRASDVWMNTPDGVRLHAWWVTSNGSRLATLFLHGNAGNITDRAARIREIVGAGSSVLMLDYRGYGKSQGRPTEKGLYTDSETAFIHLLGMGYHGKQIIVHGESLGTAVAIDLAWRRPCGGLVLEAPFPSASDLAGTVVPGLGPILVRSFNSMPKIRWILAPKLFMHGDRDEIIPLRFGEAVYKASQGPKSMWIVAGAGHNDILETGGAAYGQRLRAFYASLNEAQQQNTTGPLPRGRHPWTLRNK